MAELEFTSEDIYGFDDSPGLREIPHPDWFKISFLDLREDLNEALSEGKKGLLIYFGQENCAYCEALMNINLKMPDIVEYTQRNFDVIAVDIWGARSLVDPDGDEWTEREYSVMLGTNFTPSFIFLDKTRQMVFRLRGYHAPYRFRAALEYAADGHYVFESFREYLARANPPPKFELEDMNEESFFASPPHFLDRSHFAASRPLAVFFEQRDCHACDILHSDPVADDGVRNMLKRMDVVQLDMWGDEPVLTPSGKRQTSAEWATELDISYAPTLVFFDEKGLEVFRIDSVVQLYRLGRVLEYVAEGGYKTGMNYQEWHGHRSLRAARPDA